jgi:flagellar basal-body rod protein FlgC
MGLFESLNISASGLSAERLRMDVISSNIANANSTETVRGGPYRRKIAVLAPQTGSENFRNVLQDSIKSKAPYSGVRVLGIMEDSTALKRIYDPQHPQASADGYVEYPNVDVMKEMVELITASRSYEANVTAMNSTKSMFLKTLEIGRL